MSRPRGVEGEDYQYRTVVEDHYKQRAVYKSSLKTIIYVLVIYVFVGAILPFFGPFATTNILLKISHIALFPVLFLGISGVTKSNGSTALKGYIYLALTFFIPILIFEIAQPLFDFISGEPLYPPMFLHIVGFLLSAYSWRVASKLLQALAKTARIKI
eukprot:TRINITY_DN12745_c0_g1_i1.p1 TRINITY_DN12745_c0_g1~~TRINITY_DN12745_c0_g1_i1.p1  ORF type:complete len:158 (-),score=12.25 TRINITY_DN12745_c0_g1_i1:21-494(-)